jgi:hypothetical protein
MFNSSTYIPELCSETNEFRICLDIEVAFYSPYKHIGIPL